MWFKFSPAFGLLLAAVTVPARAQDEEVPYWASIRAGEVNLRVGPAETYRISWVYHRPQLPMKVLRRNEGWRLVQDPDGEKGWMLARFLSRERGAIVKGQGPADMYEKATSSSRLLWRLQPGVVGRLGDCDSGLCRFEVHGRAGFVPEARLWGVGAP
jgi:SH3-like domain-containing protein